MLDRKFQKAEDEYRRVVEMDCERTMTPYEFESTLQELVVEHEGRYWMIGARTGRWHVYDGENWREAEPPQSQDDAPRISSGYEVILVRFSDTQKFNVIKTVRKERASSGERPSGLAFAKRLTELLPAVVCRDISFTEASAVKESLERAGGEVEIRASS